MNKIIPLLALALGLNACAHSQFLATTEKTYEPWTGPVKILREVPKGIKYEELGWVSGTMTPPTDWGTLLKSMQKKAASKGANAIILFGEEAFTQADMSIRFSNSSSDSEKNLMAIAIRIIDN